MRQDTNPALNYMILFLLAAVFIVPFFWVFQTSLKHDAQIFSQTPRWIPTTYELEDFQEGDGQQLHPLIEDYGFALTFTHYERTLSGDFPFYTYLMNSLIVVIFTVIGTIFSSAVGGYAFACLRWPDRDALFFIVLATMLLPYQVTLIPLFVIFRNLGWIDTFLPLIVPAFFGTPFFIFLMRQFFLSIPRTMLEAARIDGAAEWRILSTIVMPLSKPALLTVAIFSGMFAWNDFLGPLIYLTSENKKTLALGLQSLVSEFQTEWGLLMAAGSIMILPILIVFFFAQRYFIEGITLTGLKQ